MENTRFFRRVGAMLYDGLLTIAVLFLATIPFVALRDGESVDPGSAPYQLSMLTIVFVFYVGFWSRFGRTLGMQSWGLRIEDQHGNLPGIAPCSIRFFAALLSWLPAGLGYFWQLVDRDRLTWHDRLSGTRLRHYPRKPKG